MTAFDSLGPADFQSGMLRLLPRGRAWPRRLTSVLAAIVSAAGDVLAALHARSVALLLRESDPTLAIECLPDHETDYGLPDPCTPSGTTVNQRHAALLAKIRSLGGQSIAYYESVAAALGYSRSFTVTEGRGFRIGIDAVGVVPVCNSSWNFVWNVTVPNTVVHYFDVGTSAIGEPLWTIDNAELPCRLNQIKPAHTVLIFQFG